jgi:hypothetical protein
VYHLELRQFPHKLCRFNLNKQELREIVEPWAHEQWVELGERKWSPHQARLTILEGPHLPLDQLSMDRGWRNAQRHGEDVTDRVLTAAKAPGSAARVHSPDISPGVSPDIEILADSLGLELLSLLADGPAPLSRAWRLASARCPERSASESLALAERALRSLLGKGLIVLLHPVAGASGGVPGAEEADGEVGPQEVEQALRAVGSWAHEDAAAPEEGASAAVRMRRV